MAQFVLPPQKRRYKCLRNEAYTRELDVIPNLLYYLCRTLQGSPPSPRKGRPPLSYKDRAYCVILTEFCRQSMRRSEPLWKWAAKKKLIERSPAFNSVCGYYNSAELTPRLQTLLRLSSAPTRASESAFALDGTHFALEETLNFANTYTANRANGRRYVMLHLAGGVNTKIVTAAEVDICLDKYFKLRHDSHFTELLLNRTQGNYFPIEEVWADKAYASKKNRILVESSLGAKYKISEKKSGRIPERPVPDFVFCECQECFKRNQIETINSMIKQIFSDKVENLTVISLENELLSRVIAHNLRVLLQLMVSRDLVVDFDEHVVADKKRLAAGAHARLPKQEDLN